MLISELPDECLLEIFDYINDLDDLVNCFKVCVKWSYLVTERTKRTKYLLGHPFEPIYSVDYVYYQGEEPIDGNVLRQLFGNLIIVDFSYGFDKKVKHEDIIELVKSQESLKGFIHIGGYYDEPIENYIDKPELVQTNVIEESLTRNGSSVKQLILVNYTLDYFKEDAHHFPNLERLHINNNEGNPDNYYDGPVMEKLKMVELDLSSYDGRDTYYGFQFMDSCPNLQSAHISVDSDSLFADETVKHESLQDLVINFFYSERINWDELKRLFMKYPNLKHLALRYNKNIKDENIEQLVQILPNLVLFDVRGCRGVTQRAADYVRDYCKRYGKSIKFYFEIEPDGSQLSAKKEIISRGFDFMKYCFFKYFHSLPVFLIPIDNGRLHE